MPAAARVTNLHKCDLVDAAPHVGGPITTGAPTVMISHQKAARLGDEAVCTGSPAPDKIVEGSSTVSICGKPAARVGDHLAHGGTIQMGDPNVFIGGSAQAVTLKAAGGALVEMCEGGGAPRGAVDV